MRLSFQYIITGLYFCTCLAAVPACKKQDAWLNVKNNKSSVVPETLADFQAIMDNSNPFNDSYTQEGLMGSDDFYLPDAEFQAAGETERNLYIWNKTIWPGDGGSSLWTNLYKIVEYSNVVLDGLGKQSLDHQSSEYLNIKGQALFHRALANYTLAQIFCKEYSKNSGSDLGLPMRLNSDVNEIVQRSSLDKTYLQIISDLNEAKSFLPDTQPFLQRPVRAAAHLLMAKTLLHMEDYAAAGGLAAEAIERRPTLLDYNDPSKVSLASEYRFNTLGSGNPEVLFYAESFAFREVRPSTSSPGVVSPELYNLYDENDLRKTLLYAEENGAIKFRGSFSGNYTGFCGLTGGELYLIAAECQARLGNTAVALNLLNTLLVNRYKSGRFTPLTGTDQEKTLVIILGERRKELAFSANNRWEDLRRLNKDVRFSKVLKRSLNGLTYQLPAGDQRYILPIPLNEINLSGIEQNER